MLTSEPVDEAVESSQSSGPGGFRVSGFSTLNPTIGALIITYRLFGGFLNIIIV